MIGKLDAELQLHSDALRLRGQRQEMIASNLANADTPNYKAVDFKFADALRQAVGGQGPSSPSTLARTAVGHMNSDGSRSGSAPTQVLYRTPTQASVDGNTVDVDVERAQFADNAVRYEASLRFLNGKLKTLLSAIQSQ
ncbi:MAG TPA: flagellar basal body rod protein FlgB [Burkholderiales bacterium]|nr:flagellar basal body rod protein FlgB [Burkholderiales bacterium]